MIAVANVEKNLKLKQGHKIRYFSAVINYFIGFLFVSLKIKLQDVFSVNFMYCSNAYICILLIEEILCLW